MNDQWTLGMDFLGTGAGRAADVLASLVMAVVFWFAIIPMFVWPNIVGALFLDLDPSWDHRRNKRYRTRPTLIDRLLCAGSLVPVGVLFVLASLQGLWSPTAVVAADQERLRRWAFGRMAE